MVKSSVLEEWSELLRKKEQDVLLANLLALKSRPSSDKKKDRPVLSKPEGHVTQWIHIGALDSSEDIDLIIDYLKQEPDDQVDYQYLAGDAAAIKRELSRKRFYWLVLNDSCLESFYLHPEKMSSLLRYANMHLFWLGEQIAISQDMTLTLTAMQIAWMAAGSGFSVSACARATKFCKQLVELFSQSVRDLRYTSDGILSRFEQFVSRNENQPALGETGPTKELLNAAVFSEKKCSLASKALNVPGSISEACFEGKTLLLCGAGPSLSEVMEQLSAAVQDQQLTLSGSCIVAAAGSALALLESAGVGVDLYFALDPYITQVTRLRRIGHVTQPVIARPRWNHQAKEFFSGPIMLAGGSTGYPLADRAIGLSDPSLMKVTEGPNVCAFAMSWAAQAGFDRILLAGMDLCYEEDVPYPSLCSGEQSNILQHWSASDFYGFSADLEGICNDGKVRKTSNQWLVEKQWMEDFVQNNPKIDVVRICRKGLKIDCAHAEPEKMLSLMKKEGRPQVDGANIAWHYASQCSSLPQSSVLKEGITESWQIFEPFCESVLEVPCKTCSSMFHSLLEKVEQADAFFMQECFAFFYSLPIYSGLLSTWDQSISARYHFIEKSSLFAGAKAEIDKVDLDRSRLLFLFKALQAIFEETSHVTGLQLHRNS